MRTAAITFLAMLLVLCLPTLSMGQSDASFAIAVPLKGITIDGNLDDWPNGLERHAILHHGQAYGPTDIDEADLTGSPDLTASFMVGYSPAESLLYLAVTMRDDSLANGRPLNATDGCEIYLEGNRQRNVSDMSSYQAGMTAAIQYVLCPPGGSYDSDTPGQPPSPGFRMFMGDITKTRTKAAFSRKGDISVFEWAVELYDHFPDRPTRLIPGRTLGVDVVVNDVDGQNMPAWVCWGTYKPLKFFNADSLGDILLVDDRSRVGTVSGQVVNPRDNTPFADFGFEVFRGKDSMGAFRTDAGGKYRMTLAAGKYTIRPQARQGVETGDAASITVNPGSETTAAVTPRPVQYPKALLKAVETYRPLRGYRDSTIVAVHIRNPDEDREVTIPYAFSMSRPNLLKMECGITTGIDHLSLYCDGKELTAWTLTQNRYIREPAPTEFDFSSLPPSIWQSSGNMLDLAFLFSGDPLRMLSQSSESIREAGRETLNGEPATLIEIVKAPRPLVAARSVFSILAPRLAGADTVAVRLWIRDRDGLIMKSAFRVDLEKMSQGLPEQARAMMQGTVDFSVLHTKIELNPSFGTDAFTFTPPDGAQEIRISSEPATSRAPTERKLDGKPAPEFSLKDIQGKERTLSELKGKMILLDFWASWNDSSVATLKMVQSAYEKFRDKDFAVFGINTLEEESSDGVKQFLDAQKITCPILLDPENIMSEKFGFKKIPICYLIDKQGIVRGSFSTLPNGDILTRVLEKLLQE